MEKKFVKIAVGIAICFLCIFLLTGCAKQEAETQVTDSMFTDNDMEIGYDEETATKITLTGDSAESDSDAVTISGSVVTISEEGTYILSGTLNDGMVIVDAGDEDKLRIVLDDARDVYKRQVYDRRSSSEKRVKRRGENIPRICHKQRQDAERKVHGRGAVQRAVGLRVLLGRRQLCTVLRLHCS